jgi:Recombinase
MQGGRPARPRPAELMAELDEFGRYYRREAGKVAARERELREHRDKIIRRVYVRGIPMTTIAAALGISAQRVSNIIASQRELTWEELRERIRTMRAEGMTFHAIADQLNEEGVPPPRGRQWRSSSVQTLAGSA